MVFPGRKWAKRPRPERQGEFGFVDRQRRLSRLFRVTIVGVTCLVWILLLALTDAGRRGIREARWAAQTWVTSWRGEVDPRIELDSIRTARRMERIEASRKALGLVEEKGGPAMREFLKVAGLDSDSALLRWGNFDWTLALSSHVFEPDESGRSYRLKPSQRSVWLINLTVQNVLAMFEIPDTPEARRLGEKVGGRIVPESVQTTNTWGCRGPEPDPSAAFRVLVLGDSNMQGLLVADDQTPSYRLERRLQAEFQTSVSVLNTGHLGYSIEQYDRTFQAYVDRFQPHFVVISLCANDFGDMSVEANWLESEYWLDSLVQSCRTRQIDFIAVPIPLETAILGRRKSEPYPARLLEIFHASGSNYLDPIEDFATEQLAQRALAIHEGQPYSLSPLFNARYGDHHLSPLGCDLWAKIIAKRIRLLLEAKDPPALPPRNLPTQGVEPNPRKSTG